MKFVIISAFLSILIMFSAFSQETISADSAINYYQRLLKKDKDSPFANYAMALVCFDKKEYKAAIQYCDQNLKRENEYSAQTYLIKAVSWDRLKMPEEAVSVFRKALKLFPNDYKLQYNYAFSCYKLQKFDEAIQSSNEVLKLAPLNFENYLLYTCLLFEKDNNRKALNYLLFALMLNQDKELAASLYRFVNDWLDKRYEKINTPYFDKRFALENIMDVYNSYCEKNSNEELNKNLPIELEDYIADPVVRRDVLFDFYNNLKTEKLERAYVNYCLRFSKLELPKKWLETNAEELNRLSTFLEKNLKEEN